MNNQIFSRLCSLMQRLGFSAQAGDVTTAEMRAYAAGLSAVYELLDKAIGNAFIDTADEATISSLITLLKITPAGTAQQNRQNIIAEMSRGYVLMTLSEILMRFFRFGYTFEGTQEKYRFSIGNQEYTAERLLNLSRIVDEVMPAYERIYSAGDYLTFDGLDSLGLRWFEIDKARLPFYIWNAVAGNNYD